MIKLNTLPENIDITKRSQVKKYLGIANNKTVIRFRQETRNELEPDSVYKLNEGCFFLTRKQQQGIVYGTLIQVAR